MCGIFAVLRNEAKRTPPSRSAVEALLASALSALSAANPITASEAASAALEEVNEVLKGVPGTQALLAADGPTPRLIEVLAEIKAFTSTTESRLDEGKVEVDLEELNRALGRLNDVEWALRRDRLGNATAIRELSEVPEGSDIPASSVEGYSSIQLALSAIDRLEVRGRDSAGMVVVVDGIGLEDSELNGIVEQRDDELLLSGAVHRTGANLVFAYKAAAEIGALGDNVRFLRAAVQADDGLRRVLAQPGSRASILSHTRWASVGTVSEPNAHPIDSREQNDEAGPYVIAALNGDVDNYASLKNDDGLDIADDITTDAKVIPVLTSRAMAGGADISDAFRSTVTRFEGSVAIAAASAHDPQRLLLAVKGSGQGCYIGLAEDTFLVASEPYGLVEECNSYFRLDGETASPASGVSGQLVELTRDGAGTLSGVRRLSYGGEELPVAEADLAGAEVTTRDIDRGEAPHFLLKEISESPGSITRTLRGKIVESGGRLTASLPKSTLPDSIRRPLADGSIKQVIGIGQGTAAVAARTVATVLEQVCPGGIPASTRLATELSGFGLRDDMSDTLIVAVSQSGTTTDTNRTVDMARARGAKVIAIVNRRQSDLTEKADGVLYTSDGRDVEMSVASTKAFYAQVAAGTLLAVAIADAVGGQVDRAEVNQLLDAFRRLPDAMVQVLAKRPEISEAAQRFAPSRRSWAIVGNGPNHIAAAEVRIKLSELCYKSIAIDGTEDKKHIDLSAEPMIFVCAAGLTGSNATDVGKEVAIYRAHKAAAVVVASEGANFDAAAAVITVPALHPVVDFLLSTMVGHLFGYEAALAIDAQGRLMRAARAALDDAAALQSDSDEQLLAHVHNALDEPAKAIFAELNSKALNGHLEPSTAVSVASLLRYATGVLPFDSLELELGRAVSPTQMIVELNTALSAAVDELTRPIDAVKHQAKTVTVGISRTEETYTDSLLVKQVVAAGAERDRLTYRTMRTLAALDEAVEDVVGYTRYAIEGDMNDVEVAARVLDQGGVAEGLTSRVEAEGRLTGTKHRAAVERMVTVGRGQRDGRSVVIVPEMQDQHVTGITLLHVHFKKNLSAETARAVLIGYRNRYSALVDAVTETETYFDDSGLETSSMLNLLVEPVWVLAQKWRSA